MTIYQKAQMLMEAVLYCIGTYKNESNNALIIQNISARDAYINGRRIVIDKAKKLQSIYNKLIINFQDYGNECLKDTITKEIPEFLLRYDFKYAPQETMISLDYPILKDLGTMTGVNVVLEYVECICLEQQFLSNFESRKWH